MTSVVYQQAGGMSVMLSGLTLCAAILYFQSGSSSTSGEVAIIGVLLFVAGFAISLGSVVWPLLGEIFPNRVRSKGMSFCLAVNWIFNLSLSFSVLSIIDGRAVHPLYFVCCFNLRIVGF